MLFDLPRRFNIARLVDLLNEFDLMHTVDLALLPMSMVSELKNSPKQLTSKGFLYVNFLTAEAAAFAQVKLHKIKLKQGRPTRAKVANLGIDALLESEALEHYQAWCVIDEELQATTVPNVRELRSK